MRAERGRFYKTQCIIIIDDFHAIVKTCKTSEVNVSVMFVTAVCLLLSVLLFLTLCLFKINLMYKIGSVIWHMSPSVPVSICEMKA